MTRGDEETVASEDDAHMSIGAPFGFKQLVHVTVDPTSSSGFNGLPDVWEKSLASSKISKEEIMEHPDAMLEVLKFACDDNAQVPVPRHSVAILQLSAGVRFKTTDPTADYGKLTQQLGKGGAGTIFLGTKKKEAFAIKVLPISHTTDMQALTTEIAIMSSTRNAFCVQYFESYNYQQSLYIVMELMDGGSLTNVIQHFQRRRECVTRFPRCIFVTFFFPRCFFVTLSSCAQVPSRRHHRPHHAAVSARHPVPPPPKPHTSRHQERQRAPCVSPFSSVYSYYFMIRL